jgi:hypothetical protein
MGPNSRPMRGGDNRNPPRCSELIPLKTSHITERNLLRGYSNEGIKACNKGCIKYDNGNRRPDLSCKEIDHM